MKKIDFRNTRIAYAYKSTGKLRLAYFLFQVFSRERLSNTLSRMSLTLLKWHIPMVAWLMKRTVFALFVGGETLAKCDKVIKKLNTYSVATVLDYAAEGKVEEDDLDHAEKEFIRAIEFASSYNCVPVVSIKLSALADNDVLEQVQQGNTHINEVKEKYDRVVQRLEDICSKAQSLNIRLFIDAEESWIQDAIDELVWEAMLKFNKDRVVVYNTYQMYRKDRLQVLKNDYEKAKSLDIMLGVKLVRGAYLEKERQRAHNKGYPSPIHDTKAATDEDYNKALEFCVMRYTDIAFCAATHNEDSCKQMAGLVHTLHARNDHPHLNFCQLYGMGDVLTFNLAHAGYNVAKYLPYGKVKEAMPYLIRRAEENSSVSGEMTRELTMLKNEMNRRNRDS